MPVKSRFCRWPAGPKQAEIFLKMHEAMLRGAYLFEKGFATPDQPGTGNVAGEAIGSDEIGSDSENLAVLQLSWFTLLKPEIDKWFGSQNPRLDPFTVSQEILGMDHGQDVTLGHSRSRGHFDRLRCKFA